MASYVHNALAPGLGKIGVLVALESSGDQDKLAALGKQIAMHVAAANPQALTIGRRRPAAAIERERAVLTEQAKASGKPEAVIAKMVEGRLRKYLRGDRAARADLRHRRREPKVKEVVREGGQGGRRAGEGRRLRPHGAGRRHRARQGLSDSAGAAAGGSATTLPHSGLGSATAGRRLAAFT